MNIIKGIDRIVLVLAIVAAIATCIYHLSGLRGNQEYNNPEWDEWNSKRNQRIKYLEEANPSIRRYVQSEHSNAINWGYYGLAPPTPEWKKILDADNELQAMLRSEPPERLSETAWMKWKKAMLKILMSVFAILAVLLSICLSTRVLKRSSLWIADGFRGGSKKK